MNKRCMTAVGHTLHVLGLCEVTPSTRKLAELTLRADLEEAIALFEIIEFRTVGVSQSSARDTLLVLRWEHKESERNRDLRRNAVMLSHRKVGEKVVIYEGERQAGEGEIVDLETHPTAIRVVSTMYPHTLPTLVFDRFGRGISDPRLSIRIA